MKTSSSQRQGVSCNISLKKQILQGRRNKATKLQGHWFLLNVLGLPEVQRSHYEGTCSTAPVQLLLHNYYLGLEDEVSLFYYAMFVDSCQAANTLFICYHTFLDNIVDIKEHDMWIILLPSNRQAHEKKKRIMASAL